MTFIAHCPTLIMGRQIICSFGNGRCLYITVLYMYGRTARISVGIVIIYREVMPNNVYVSALSTYYLYYESARLKS